MGVRGRFILGGALAGRRGGGGGRLGSGRLLWRWDLGGVMWSRRSVMGRGHKDGAGRLVVERIAGGGTWAEPYGRRSCGGGAMWTGGARAGLARCSCCAPPQHALADPGPRTGTPRRTPAAPGPSLEERGAARRVRARAAGSHRGSQLGAGRGECRQGGGGETPAGTCRSLCLRRAAPVAPPPLPPSQESDLCRTPCPGKRGSLAQCQIPCIPAGSAGRKL